MPTMDSAIGQSVINSLAAWRQIGAAAAAPEGGCDIRAGSASRTLCQGERRTSLKRVSGAR